MVFSFIGPFTYYHPSIHHCYLKYMRSIMAHKNNTVQYSLNSPNWLPRLPSSQVKWHWVYQLQ